MKDKGLKTMILGVAIMLFGGALISSSSGATGGGIGLLIVIFGLMIVFSGYSMNE